MDPRRLSLREFDRYLEELARRHADPVLGFFGPSSMTWRINRESVVYLGGMRALLMQLAHPKVAQAVADHSNFRADPFGRLFRTFDAVHAMVFGDLGSAVAAASRVHRVHRRVQGTLPSTAERSARRYEANDPELLHWVYATLVDSSIYAYQQFLPSLSASEWETYYQESKLFACMFGIPDARLAPRLVDFRGWMAATMSADTLHVSDAAREVAGALLKGPRLLLAFRPSNYVLAAGMLPARLRAEFGLTFNLPVRSAYGMGVAVVRSLTPRLPDSLRFVPSARRAMARCGRKLSIAA